MNAAVFRNRITGARLLGMTQNDLEHLGVHKVGSRIELMKMIRKLADTQKALHNFPTLEQAKRIEMTLVSLTFSKKKKPKNSQTFCFRKLKRKLLDNLPMMLI